MFFFLTWLIIAQATPAGTTSEVPVYDVAAIKPSQSTGPASGPRSGPGGRLNVTNTNLKSLISFAYEVHANQISGGPPWLDSAGWDIAATPSGVIGPSVANVDTFRAMLRKLLEDRFQLTVHRETKTLPVYALVAAKDGSKLKQSEPAIKATDARMHISYGRLTGQKMPLKLLTQMLSDYLGRPVLDQTGLPGAYDFTVLWTPDQTEVRLPLEAGQPAPDPAGPSLFTAIQEQLGLKLESQKAPVEVLVIDRAEKASAN